MPADTRDDERKIGRLRLQQSPAGLPRDELRAWVQDQGFEAYRGDQVFGWMHKKGVTDPEGMRNLPAGLRERLGAERRPALEVADVLESGDGTRKLLLRSHDDHLVETVLIPMGEWLTQCLSTQVGCRLACAFCLTGKMGLKRHLMADEIVQEVRAGIDAAAGGPPVRNYVFMGMGEPLDNFDEVVRACRILTDAKGMDLSGRRITVSTVGIADRIADLGRAVPVNLALSLNGTTDEQRSRIMPAARRWSLGELKDALKAFPLPQRRRITLEYVMLRGFNDSLADARRLVRFADGLRVKVNLIPFNPFEGSDFRRPDDETVAAFQERLLASNIATSVRAGRGLDIGAACGQLGRAREAEERPA